MKVKTAAVLEPHDGRWKTLTAALKRAGLKVSPARSPDALKGEHMVVVPTVKSAAKVARAAKLHCPDAVLVAGLSKGFKASWADAVLPLPISPNDLRVRLAEWDARRELHPMPPHVNEGILDPITSFYTFSHFKEVLFVEVKRARRYGFPLALACIGFDPDTRHTDALRGQLMGGLALAMRRSLRDTDYPVQYSSERVLLLMPHTDLAGSLIVARRICERVAKASLQVGSATVQPTISVGVASGDPGRELGFSDLVKQAQEGLAAAMAAGGNRVEFFTGPASMGEPQPLPRIPPVALPKPPAVEG